MKEFESTYIDDNIILRFFTKSISKYYQFSIKILSKFYHGWKKLEVYYIFFTKSIPKFLSREKEITFSNP